jgi:hypothetical protein
MAFALDFITVQFVLLSLWNESYHMDFSTELYALYSYTFRPSLFIVLQKKRRLPYNIRAPGFGPARTYHKTTTVKVAVKKKKPHIYKRYVV